MTKETEQQAAEIEHLANQEAFKEQQEQANQQGEFIPNDGGMREQIESLSTGDMMAGLLITTFGLLAKVRGDHWKVKPEVLNEAGQEYGNVIDHYFPDYKAAPWVGAVGVSAFIFAPPLIEEMRIKQAKKQQEADEADNGDKS